MMGWIFFKIMIYLIKMKKSCNYTKIFTLAIAILALLAADAFCQEHIRDLDGVRTKMADLGNRLPGIIKSAKPQDLRTLERVFEINNYALVTIESYLKMIKVALSSSEGINNETVTVLNGWLKFIRRYCEYDIKYFEEALKETTDDKVIEIVKNEQANISRLMIISDKGVDENNKLFKKK